MNVMEAYAKSLSDAELMEMLTRNLVRSQMQFVEDEASARGLLAEEV